MVHFVGAGSGAADLITVRGARLLGEADVVIYAGSLVNPALLEYTKAGCEIHDSAKLTLEEVIALIEVKVTPQREMGFDKIAERIYQYSEVTSVYLMSGGYDFTVMIEAKTMRAVAQFVAEKLSTIDSVLSTATHFILKKYKDHGTVLCDGPQDERMLIVP